MRIAVYDDWIEEPKAFEEDNGSVVLTWDGEYRNKGRIEFTDLIPDKFYFVKVDAAIDEALVLIKSDKVVYKIPFYEKKTSYNPIAFVGNRHIISIREAEDFEINSYRNLAANPFDQHEEASVYPHASANVETRGEAVFAARNAIDGTIATKHHGDWPYESWGINMQDDAEFKLDFGRPVDIDRIDLYTRADFPHDNWWRAATFSFSDGTTETVSIEKEITKPHTFMISRKAVSWIKLGNLIKADDPSPFPALSQIKVFGTEAK